VFARRPDGVFIPVVSSDWPLLLTDSFDDGFFGGFFRQRVRLDMETSGSASGGLAVYELSASDIVNMFELRDDRQGLGSLFHEGSTGFSISPAIDCLQLRPGRLQHLALLRVPDGRMAQLLQF